MEPHLLHRSPGAKARPRTGKAPKRPTTDVPLLAPSSLADQPGMFTYRRTVAGYHVGIVAKLATMLTQLSDVDETSYEVTSDLRLPDIPLAPSGKVDRAALPTPDIRPEQAEGAAAPDNATARVVRDAWTRVLGVEAGALRPSSDFHRLGGTSVMLLTVVAEISRAVLGKEGEDAFVRQLGAIVRNPTLGGMTEVVSQLR